MTAAKSIKIGLLDTVISAYQKQMNKAPVGSIRRNNRVMICMNTSAIPIEIAARVNNERQL
jgi:hypothetical protein